MRSIKCMMIFFTLIQLSYSEYVWSMSIERSSKVDDYVYLGMNSQHSNHYVQTRAETSETIIIRGDYLKAAMAAGKEFKKYIRNKWHGNPSPIAPYMSDINNYSISISKDKGNEYEVHFAPLPFRGGPIKGGGTTYFIDSKSFKILKKEHSM